MRLLQTPIGVESLAAAIAAYMAVEEEVVAEEPMIERRIDAWRRIAASKVVVAWDWPCEAEEAIACGADIISAGHSCLYHYGAAGQYLGDFLWLYGVYEALPATPLVCGRHCVYGHYSSHIGGCQGIYPDVLSIGSS